MALTHPTGFPVATNGDTVATPAPATVTFPHAYGSVGDLAIIGVVCAYAIPIASMAGTNTGTWTLRARYQDATNGVCLDVWTAPVTSTSGADVVTPNYNGVSTTGQFGNFWPDSVSAGFGSNTVWTIAAFGTSSGTGSTMTYPNLVAATTVNSQAYWGVGAAANLATGGTTTGFSYIDSPIVSGNEQIYNLSLASGTPYAPTSTQNTSSFYDAAAIIVEAANSGGVTAAGRMFFSAVPGSTTFPPPEVTSLSVTQGPAAGGTATTLNGVYFSGATSVKFGTTSSGFNITSPTTITTTSPAGAAGATVNVSVTGPAGTSTNSAGNQFTYASGGGGGGSLIPNVPAGTQIPTQLILGPGVSGALGTAGEFANYPTSGSFPTGSPNSGVFQPFWGTDGSDTATGPAGQPTVTKGANVSVVNGQGVVLTMQPDGSSALIDSNPTWVNPGFAFQPTASAPVFTEFYVKLAGNGTSSFAAGGTMWHTGQSWPQTGEIDIVETGFNTLDYSTISPAGNGPGLPANFPYLSVYGGFCTYGCLWTTSSATFFYNGQQMGGTQGLPYLFGPFYLVASLMLPVNGGYNPPFSQIVSYIRVWKGPTSAHP